MKERSLLQVAQSHIPRRPHFQYPWKGQNALQQESAPGLLPRLCPADVDAGCAPHGAEGDQRSRSCAVDSMWILQLDGKSVGRSAARSWMRALARFRCARFEITVAFH